MLSFILKRLVQGVITVWFIATATFIAMHAVPGDPLRGERLANERIRTNLQARYGLDRPILEQYTIYIGSMARGDFGISYTQQNRRVNDIIREHFPVSATLGILAIVVATFGGVLWGALTAVYRNRLPDIVIMFLVIIGISVPSFVVAALSQLVLVSANSLFGRSLLPVAGWGTVWHMLVPALVLGLSTTAYLTRLMRSSMLEITSADFVRTARAKGVPERRVLYRHALRNAFVPTIVLAGLSLPTLFGGAVFVEKIFSWPGMGLEAANAFEARDYQVVVGATLLGAVLVVIGGILTDVLHAVVDPRVRTR